MTDYEFNLSVYLADSLGKCRMTKRSECPNVRTPFVDGEAITYPRLGKIFIMRGESIDPMGTCRVVNTSRLVEITMLADGVGMVLTTESGSRYLLEAQ